MRLIPRRFPTEGAPGMCVQDHHKINRATDQSRWDGIH
jgi:hypothetical protein